MKFSPQVIRGVYLYEADANGKIVKKSGGSWIDCPCGAALSIDDTDARLDHALCDWPEAPLSATQIKERPEPDGDRSKRGARGGLR